MNAAANAMRLDGVSQKAVSFNEAFQCLPSTESGVRPAAKIPQTAARTHPLQI
jgi:hypothetical protein